MMDCVQRDIYVAAVVHAVSSSTSLLVFASHAFVPAPYRIQQNIRGGKLSWFLWFFTQSRNVFLQIMALSIGNVSLQACYRESFSMNGNLYPNHENFPTRRLPYTVYHWRRKLLKVRGATLLN